MCSFIPPPRIKLHIYDNSNKSELSQNVFCKFPTRIHVEVGLIIEPLQNITSNITIDDLQGEWINSEGLIFSVDGYNVTDLGLTNMLIVETVLNFQLLSFKLSKVENTIKWIQEENEKIILWFRRVKVFILNNNVFSFVSEILFFFK